MDELAVADGKNSRFLTTMSHPNKSISGVVEFAKAYSTTVMSEVEYIRV